MRNTRLVITFLFLFMPAIVFSQPSEISGYITDFHSSIALPDANVVLEGMRFGAAADNNGFFVIRHVPAGQYIIQVSRIGYGIEKKEIKIQAGQSMTVNLRLKARAVRSGEVLVTATRENELQSEVSVASQIISRSAIEQTGSQNLGEILENATGLFAKNYGHVGSLKTASIRGASENQVLVLLDGQRLNLAQGTAPDLGDIPLHAIERIEVIRGGHSALYGSDAVGGVINLITRSFAGKRALSGQVSSTIASFGSRTLAVNFGQEVGALRYFVAHNNIESDGDYEFEDSPGERAIRTNNGLKMNDTFLKLEYAARPTASIAGYFQFHDADRGVPGPLSFASETAIQKDRSWKYNLNYNQKLGSHGRLQAQAFVYKFKQNFDDPGAFFPIQSKHRNDAYGFNLQSTWRLASANEMTGGYEFREDDINSTDVSSHKRTINSVYLQDQIKISLERLWSSSHLRLIPAFRVDKYSDLDLQFSPKMGFLFNHVTSFQMILRGNWGRSYRVPSFNDLYWPAGPFTVGNPDLAPEKGFGFDIGAELNFKTVGFWGFELNYFDTDLDNLIIWGPREDGIWSPQNVQNANVSGVEAKMSFDGLGDLLHLETDYNYLDAVDGANGNQLISRPKHKFDLNLNLRIGAFDIHGSYRLIGKRYSSADNSSSLDSYSITNMGASWKQAIVGGTLKIQFELRNVFDEQLHIIEGYPVPGREYRTKVGFGF